MNFLLRVRKTGQELSRDIKKNKKRGKPKTGHCEGAMNNSDMDTRDDIQQDAIIHHHNDSDENVRTSTTVIRAPKY